MSWPSCSWSALAAACWALAAWVFCDILGSFCEIGKLVLAVEGLELLIGSFDRLVEGLGSVLGEVVEFLRDIFVAQPLLMSCSAGKVLGGFLGHIVDVFLLGVGLVEGRILKG